MTNTPTPVQNLQTHIDRHFSQSEQDVLEKRMSGIDQSEIDNEWNILIAEGRLLQAEGDPDSQASRIFAQRWMAQVRRFAGNDSAMVAKAAQVNIDALSDPRTASHVPFDMEPMRFVTAAYRSAGGGES